MTSIGASLSAPSAVVSKAGQLPGEAIGGSGLGTGAMLLPPMLLVGSFWRWLLQGGAALAIGAVAVYLAWSSAIDFNWWAWPAGIVAASLVFALLTYSLVRPALSLAYSSTPAPSPTDM